MHKILDPLEQMIADTFASSDILSSITLYFGWVRETGGFPYCMTNIAGWRGPNRNSIETGKCRNVIGNIAINFSFYVAVPNLALLTDSSTGVLQEVNRIFNATRKFRVGSDCICTSIHQHFPWQTRFRTHDQVKHNNHCYQGFSVFDFEIRWKA